MTLSHIEVREEELALEQTDEEPDYPILSKMMDLTESVRVLDLIRSPT
jgi:hypothetical protein